MLELNDEDVRQLGTLFESLGINHLEVYQRVLDELPVLKNLIECFGMKCMEIDTKLMNMEKELNDIKSCLNILIKKWC